MYLETVQRLKAAGLIKDGDIVAACEDAPSTAAFFWGGAIGAAIAGRNRKFYILTANSDEIRLFDVDKTGVYLNSYVPILRQDIVKAGASGLIGGKNIVIKTHAETLRFLARNKVQGNVQKESLKALQEFLKTNFGKK